MGAKYMEEYLTGNATVDALTSINFTGNVIPQMWYKTILKENGKPHLLAITLLADIVYWYRPIEIREEQSGKFIGYKKKFKDADLLQRSYSQFSELFGESKRSITEAIVRLEDIGVVKRVFRTVVIGGVPYNNVLFLELYPDKLYELTYPGLVESSDQEEVINKDVSKDSVQDDQVPILELDTPITKKSERGHKNENNEVPLSQNKVRGVTKISERGHGEKGEGSQNFVTRNTKITTENTTEISSSSEQIEDEKFKSKIGFDSAVEKFGNELPEAVFQEIKRRNSIDAISATQVFYEICNNIWLYSSKIKNKNKYIGMCIENLLEAQKLVSNREHSSPEVELATKKPASLTFQQFQRRDYGDMQKLEEHLLSRK